MKLAAFAAACLFWAGAHAAAPQLRTQGPGYSRMMLGDFEITSLSDGVFDPKTDEMLTNITKERRKALLVDAFEGDAAPTSVNAYLINTGDRLVLVDTGAAPLFGPTLGHLRDNLVASGYLPEQVDTILVTHMHPDHIGGLVVDGTRVFPNATVDAEQREADFWSSATALALAPADRKDFFRGAAAAMRALRPRRMVQDLRRQDRSLSWHQRDPRTRTYARPHDLRGRVQGQQARAVG